MFLNSFFDAVSGVRTGKTVSFHNARGDEVELAVHEIVEPLKQVDSPAAREAAFMAEVTGGHPFKVTLPAASIFLHPFTTVAGAYESVEEFAEAAIEIERSLVREVLGAGGIYLQFDFPLYPYLVDPTWIGRFEAAGFDIATLMDRAIAADAAVLEGMPNDVTIGLHICRGNYRSSWMCEGSLEPVAERVFGELPYDRFLVEWDDLRRDGGFEPIRFLRPGSVIVMGLVSTKTPRLEDEDDLVRRMEEAAGYVKGMERLAVSPQCGFASPADSPLRLDAPREEALARAAKLIEQAWRSFDRFRPEEPPLDERVRALLRSDLPEEPSPVFEVLDDVARILDESIAQPRPRYFAFIGSSGLEIGAVGDALASCYDINLAVHAGAATEIEKQAVRWVAEFVGYPATAGGAFTSGGTISNMTALSAARERALPGSRTDGMAGRRGAVYCSREVHYSITRAVELLGIGSSNIRALPIDDERKLRPDAVAEAIDRDREQGVTPVAVVATGGTTLTGAVDPTEALAEVCAERGVWLHLDGAYGLPAAATSSGAHLFAGVERADSCSVDAHKWLYLPKACGVVLVRRPDDLAAAFAHQEGYLPHQRHELHAVDITLEYSRPFRALKAWLAFRAHGAPAFREAIERNLHEARLLYEAVKAQPDFEVLGPPPQLSIVPFRHTPRGAADLNDHNARLAQAMLADGRVYLASALIDDEVYLRPCFVNFRTTEEDVLAIIDVARELGDRLARGG